MRFSVVLSGLFAIVAAAETTASAPATSVSMSPAQASQLACYNACDKGDVNCQAHCVSVCFYPMCLALTHTSFFVLDLDGMRREEQSE